MVPSNGDGVFQSGDAEVDAEEAIFVALIQTLLKEPAEREHFYQARQLHSKASLIVRCILSLLEYRVTICYLCSPQEVFPTEYGLSYDTDMQLLVWEFLSKLEKLLPVPDLSQVRK